MTHRKISLLFGGTFSLLILFFFLTGTPLQAKNRMAAKDTIQIYGDKNFPPFMFINAKGEADGFAIDIIQEVMKIIDKPYTIRLGTIEEMVRGMKEKKCDLIPFVGKMDAQFKTYDFSYTYNYAYQSVLVLNRKDIQSSKDLKGKSVCVENATLTLQDIRNLGIMADSICYAENSTKKIEKVLNKSVDAAIDYQSTFFYKIKEMKLVAKNLKIINSSINKEPNGICIQKGKEALLEQINNALVELKLNGKLSKMEKKWEISSPFVPNNKMRNYIIWGILLILLTLCILIYLNHRKTTINKKEIAHQLNNMYSLLLELPYPVYLSTINKQQELEFVFLNKSAKNIISKTYASKHEKILLEQNKKQIKAYCLEVCYTKESLIKQEKFAFSSGQMHYLRISASPIFSENGLHVLSICTIVDDIVNARKIAEQSDRLKTAFLANMGHDIRTPLNAIVGFSSLLLETENTEEIREYTSIIKLNNTLLLNLLTDIIDLSKIQTGDIHVNHTWNDLSDLFSDLKEMYNQEIIASGKDIQLILDNPYTSLLTYIDKTVLLRILTNFMNNAVKYTDSGFIRLGIISDHKELYIYVQDSGKGISKKQLPLIFRRYKQLDEISAGNGLGLAICAALADNCNIHIDVSSIEKDGSIFWIKAPLKHTAVPKKDYDYTAIHAILEQIKKREQ